MVGVELTCPKVDTSNMFRPDPSSRLLNLMGFFSTFPGASGWEVPIALATPVLDIWAVKDAARA